MLKLFTDRNRWVERLLLVALASGCSNVPQQPQSENAELSTTASYETVDSSVSSDADTPAREGFGIFPELPNLDLAGEVASSEPPMPVPKVDRGNAMAFDQAVAALRAGRLREAEVLLSQITEDQPELAGPWVNLGQVYVLLEQFEDARMAFAKAVSANPRSCAAHNQLGVLSRQYGDFQSAEEHYRSCLTNVPGYKDAYLNLGILYELYLGKLPQALEAYRRYQVLAAEPDRRVKGWVMDLERRLGV
jgi:tetratricopeptide (TPR) repeat protein